MINIQEIHIEKDFWDDFIVEAFEHIEEIENNAMSLEQNPENMDIIHTMFRAFHTLKGLSGFVEHTIIQEVAHKTETLMDYCRKGELKVSTDIVNAILKASDYIKQLCDNVDAYNDESLISNIENLLIILEKLATIEENPFVTGKTESQPGAIPEEITEAELEPEPVITNENGLEAFAKEFTEIKTEEDKETPAEIEIEDESYEQAKESQVTEKEYDNTIVFESQINQTIEQPKEDYEEISNETISEDSSKIVFETSISENINEPSQDEIKIEEIKTEIEEPSHEKTEEKVLTSFQKDILEKLKGNPVAQKEEAQKETAVKNTSANEEYMKVANYKIDHLVDMMGELIINQALIDQYVSLNYNDDRQLVTNMSGFLRITRELQNLSMSLRMVSLKSTFQKVTRIARDTIQELNKNVEFVTSGENTEIDRAVAEKLLDPLVHMIKNAISHGIEEDPTDRVKLDKNPRAKVELNAYSKRGKIFIEVKDDGKGINTEIVYKKALEKGIIDPTKTYSEAEIKEFIMLPGFSTAKVVDNISGRGVGMDVVKTQVFKLGGKIDIQSTLNTGSTFTLEVPVNHAIMNGTIIEINEQHFVVPTINVKEFLQPTPSQWIFTKERRTMIKVRDNIIPIVPISTFFKGIKEPEHVPLVMVLELDQELRAVPIVNVINRQEVVVKPVGVEFSHLKYISGMSILGTGKVSLILDIDYLFKKEVKE